MIYSNLRADGLSAYPDAIRRAVAWLKSTDVLALPAGRVEIEGSDIYALIQDVTTRPMEGSLPEVHAKYIDLMYWPQAGERIGVAHAYGTEPVAEARPENDVSFLASVENENLLATAPGDFLVLFPFDAHRPTIHPESGPACFRKVVMKIAVELI